MYDDVVYVAENLFFSGTLLYAEMAAIRAHVFLFILSISVIVAVEDEAMPDFTSGVVISTAGHTESSGSEAATKRPDSEATMTRKADGLPEISPLAAEIAKLDVDDYPEPVELVAFSFL